VVNSFFNFFFLFFSPGNCSDLVNNYTCQCEPGYTDYNCSLEIDECQSSPCIYGTGFGDHSHFVFHVKNEHRCMEVGSDKVILAFLTNNSGTCIDMVNAFSCTCQSGSTGVRCETNINDCLPSICGNGKELGLQRDKLA